MKKQVLIAGGGIGGMAAALAASRAGWDVRMYERVAEFSEVGAGVQLGPNVVRCLQAWGLQKALQQVAAFPDRLQVRCALSGAELGVLPLSSASIQRGAACAAAPACSKARAQAPAASRVWKSLCMAASLKPTRSRWRLEATSEGRGRA